MVSVKKTRKGAKPASPRQIEAIKTWVESGGKISKGEAMTRAGYSEVTAHNPAKVFSGPTYESLKEEIEAIVPRKLVLERLKEGLDATKVHSSHTEPDQVVPDYHARHKYVHTASQMHGLLEAEVAKTPVIIPILIKQRGSGADFTISGNRITREAV